MKKYQPQTFESKWAKTWIDEKTYRAGKINKDPEKNRFILDMFPYPSGAGLHVGHPRGYTATDIISRFYRMNGFSVLHPMGWDAYGLPAENAAIKTHANPKQMVPANIVNFKRQMQILGFSYDWDCEIATSDPQYFRWTQWLFIHFFKMGLLTKRNTPINYCPVCKTGLAEEEVLGNGTHERCGNPIVKKELPQWIFRITEYADPLIEGLSELKWPTGILEMQKNWIGKKEGATISYPIEGSDQLEIHCFTTRPDTNFGATFIVIAPEHEIIGKLLDGKLGKNQITEEKRREIKEYIEKTGSKTEIERMSEGREKTGVFTGLYATNRLNGTKLPVWISDFVLKDFGTGAVVGVPGHDLRDFEFAKKFEIPIKRVVVGPDDSKGKIEDKKDIFEGTGVAINSGFLDGLSTYAAMKVVTEYLEKKGWGKSEVSYHLRDWVFSRQRYWGEPIPMVYCTKCAKEGVSYFDQDESEVTVTNEKIGKDIIERQNELKKDLLGWFPIRENQLPLELPDVESYEPLPSGESPLAAMSSFTKAECPHCGGDATRETDTMPNWAGSCWYFLKFAQNSASGSALENKTTTNIDEWTKSQKAAESWLPVYWYIGGAEHAVLHLLYARFWVKAMQDTGLVKISEPFMRLKNVGMVLAEDHRKMSKSLGNVINPDDIVREYGADALHVYEMFMAPFSQEIPWSLRTLQGSYRFLRRIWDIYQLYLDKKNMEDESTLVSMLGKTEQKVAQDIELLKFNTAIASMMEFINAWEPLARTGSGLSRGNAGKFLQILAPFAPFITEEIWHETFGEKGSIHLSKWPKIESTHLNVTSIEIPVQIDGKVRGVVAISPDSTEKEVLEEALKDEKINSYLEGKKYTSRYVKGRILSVVITK